MKVFISWSGQRSKVVAEIFSDWLKCVIQASQPWISTRDIDRGAIWFSEINDKLKDVSVGVVCLTQENKNKPWILFETGALAKGLTTNRVCTFLIDLNPEDLQDPLAQFNHTT
ncbi:TPA: TIR domain-containing protein, partial [Enterobacter hormaechei subsp. steigerwaltii]